jgi:putative restriction endonuclease
VLNVRLYIAITDGDWYRHLSRFKPDEVNLWQPSARTHFSALDPGEPLLFKLHSPDDYLVGGGFFSHFTILPVIFVWSAFEEKNGASSEHEMRLRVEKYRRTVRAETGYSTDEKDGAALSEQVQQRIMGQRLESLSPELAIPEQRFGNPLTVLHRLGQDAFRVIVTDGYDRQCVDRFARPPCAGRSTH